MTIATHGPALLERADALDALDDAFAAAAGARGALMLLAGEAGVGKTALLRRFCEHRDAQVLWGDCDALFTLSPLGPLTDISAATGGELAAAVGDAAPAHVVTAALLRALRGPAIVVFEDVHWADEATLDVLRLLGRRIAGVPALVIASYRDDELDRTHPLRVTLGELSRQATTRRLRLAPLSLGAVAELAEPHGVDAAALHRRTAGNPFFVTEALAAGGVELPATVRDAVLARVRPLSAPARRVLDAASIVHGTIDPPLIEALAGEDVEHLEECLSCGVLGAAGAGVSFRHELARVAVEEALIPNARLALHRRALRRARRPGGPGAARLPRRRGRGRRRGAALRARRGRARRRRRRAPRGRRAVRARPALRRPARPGRAGPAARAPLARVLHGRPARRGGGGSPARARVLPRSWATAAARATCCGRSRASSGAPA